MTRATASEIQRFESKFIKTSSCWEWNSPLDRDGYGTFYFRKRNRRAHRVAYYIYVGDIPNGLVIDHICLKPNCVRPDHLRAITQRENTLDGRGVGAINARKTHCKLGHKFDKVYGKQRYCTICSNAKSKRLQKKWASEDIVKC